MSVSPFRAHPASESEPAIEAGAVAKLPVVDRQEDVSTESSDPQSREAAPAQPVTEPEGGVEPVAGVDSPVIQRPLVRQRKQVPSSGMRRLVYVLTGGAVNPGVSRSEAAVLSRTDRLQQPLRGRHVTTYLCLKGGIAKTSTCIGVAQTFAQLRADATLACDFNPDAGDLAERTVGEELSGVTSLAQQVDSIESVADLSRFLVTVGRLTVLPGEPDPQLGESLTSTQFNAVLSSVSRFYPNIHLDAGTGITHPIMPGILAETDTVVVPASYSITGARRAAATLEWLQRNGFERLARRAVVALTAKDAVSRDVDKNAVRALFPNVGVVVVPQDPHVADGAVMELDRMAGATREAYAEIAAMVADQFPRG